MIPARTLWLQVWALALVQGMITLSWVIYNFYLPLFLQQLGFAATTATVLVIVENWASAFLEPITGGVSDRIRRWLGSRLPLIMAGVLLASALFVGIPMVAGLGEGQTSVKGGFLVIVVLWACAMSTFRSPLLGLLSQYAAPEVLPQASAVLVLVGNVAAGLSPLVRGQLLNLGSLPTFLIGSLALVIAATLLQIVDRRIPSPPLDPAPSLRKQDWIPLVGVMGVGIGVALTVRMVLTVMPPLLKTDLQTWGLDWQLDQVVAAILLVAALVSLVCGWLGGRWGYQRSLLLGMGGVAVCLAVMPLSSDPGVGVGLGVITGIGLSLVFNLTLPFALAMAPPMQAGLGIGMYFGGFGIGMAALNWVLLLTIDFNSVALGLGSLFAAACCLIVSCQVRQKLEGLTGSPL